MKHYSSCHANYCRISHTGLIEYAEARGILAKLQASGKKLDRITELNLLETALPRIVQVGLNLSFICMLMLPRPWHRYHLVTMRSMNLFGGKF